MEIPESVTSICKYAFYSCSNIESVSISDGVVAIGHMAFFNCSGLTNVDIPDSVTSIGDASFDWCLDLKNVYYNGTEAEWNNISIGNSNDYLTNANRIYFAYISIFDKDGNNVIDTTQNRGEYVDTSSITVPDGYKLVLYKDREMQQEYDSSELIKENMTLYAHFAETISKTQTTVSNDGKNFAIKPINIDNGNTVILALYNGEEFVTMQSAVCNGKDIPFTVTDDYTTARVMVWNNLDDITPICEAEIVKYS